MSPLHYGHADQLAIGFFKKEATYNAGVAISSANMCSFEGYLGGFEWDDLVKDNKDRLTGLELGTTQEIIRQGMKGTLTEDEAKPNTLAGVLAMSLGNIVTVQDGAFSAWRHLFTPVAAGVSLPSTSALQKRAGLQYKIDGVKCVSWELKGEEGGPVSLAAEFMGSGTRAVDASSFPAVVPESWLLLKSCKVWLENGANVVITNPPVQDAEDISSATPDLLGPRMVSYAIRFNNNPRQIHGFGGGGVLQGIEHGRRSLELDVTMTFNDNTELVYYTNQDRLAIEFDLAGAVIAAGGAFKFGFSVIIPSFKLKATTFPPNAGPEDVHMAVLQTSVFQDGTNPMLLATVHNAKSAYMAA